MSSESQATAGMSTERYPALGVVSDGQDSPGLADLVATLRIGAESDLDEWSPEELPGGSLAERQVGELHSTTVSAELIRSAKSARLCIA